MASRLAVFQRALWSKDISAMKALALFLFIFVLSFILGINPGIIIVVLFMMFDAAQFIGFLYYYFKSKPQPSRTIFVTFLFALSGLIAMKIWEKDFTWSLFTFSTVGVLFYHCLMLVILPYLVTKIGGDKNCQESRIS